MKTKTLTALALTGLSLFLVGCSNEKLEEPTSREYETYLGEFKSLGEIKVDKTITHLFEDENGKVYYAYSDRYDLGDKDNANKKLEVYGLVLEYENVENSVFEVRRITEAPEEVPEAEVYTFEYKDNDLGFSINYPDNWSFTALRDSVRLEAPIPADAEEDFAPDYIIIALTSATLQLSEEATNEDRTDEITTFVSPNYDALNALEGKASLIGPNSLLSVLYKQASGESTYFVPRNEDLFEISFYHPTEEEGDRVSNANTFSSIVSTFKFLGGEEPVEDLAVDTEVEDPEEDQDLPAVPEPIEVVELIVEPVVDQVERVVPGEQVSISDYHEFTSNPFGFSISYPSQWYYSGGTGGYDFDLEPIEDDSTPVIRLDLNTGKNEGKTTSGQNVTITVLVDGKAYSLTGAAEYEGVMWAMADSIAPTPDEVE